METQTIELVEVDEKQQEFAKQFVEAAEPKPKRASELTVQIKVNVKPLHSQLERLGLTIREEIDKAVRKEMQRTASSAFMVPRRVMLLSLRQSIDEMAEIEWRRLVEQRIEWIDDPRQAAHSCEPVDCPSFSRSFRTSAYCMPYYSRLEPRPFPKPGDIVRSWLPPEDRDG